MPWEPAKILSVEMRVIEAAAEGSISRRAAAGGVLIGAAISTLAAAGSVKDATPLCVSARLEVPNRQRPQNHLHQRRHHRQGELIQTQTDRWSFH